MTNCRNMAGGHSRNSFGSSPPVRRLQVVGLLVALLGPYSTFKADAADTGAKDVTSVIVTRDEARVVLPVGHKDRWEWNLPTGRSGYSTEEYNWSVQIDNGSDWYSVGFRYMTNESEPKHSGTLASLLAGGIVLSQHGSGNTQGHADLNPRIEAADSAVVIAIRGEEKIAKVFSSRPATVKVHVIQPGQDIQNTTVRVTYK